MDWTCERECEEMISRATVRDTKRACKRQVSIERHETHSCQVSPSVCELSGWAKQPLRVLPLDQLGE